jgi:hypothetical protein
MFRLCQHVLVHVLVWCDDATVLPACATHLRLLVYPVFFVAQARLLSVIPAQYGTTVVSLSAWASSLSQYGLCTLAPSQSVPSLRVY